MLVKAEIDAILSKSEELHTVNPTESRRLAEEALGLSKSIGYLHGQGQATKQIGLAEFLTTGDHIVEPFREAIRLFEQTESWDGLAEALTLLGLNLGRRGEFQEAEAAFDRAIAIETQHHLRTREIHTLIQRGYMMVRRKQNPKALVIFTRALAIAESIGDPGSLCLQGLGGVYRGLKMYDKSLEYYFRSLEVIREQQKATVDASQNFVIAYGNIGLVLEEAGRQREALEYLNRALTIAEAIHDKRGAFQILTAIPRIHLFFDERENAQAAIDQMFSLVIDKMEDIFQCAAYHTRADFYAYVEDWPAMLEDLNTALVYAERVHNIDQLRTIHEALTMAHKMLGAYDKALDHHETHTKIMLEIMNGQLVESVQELEADLKQQQIIQQNEIFRLKNIDLTEANLALDNLDKEKDRFLSILQHDMRNPISSIIGYSELLAAGEDDDLSPQHVAQVIEKSARQLLNIVDSVMESARSGSLTIERKPTNIGKLLNDVGMIVRPLAEGKDLAVKIEDKTLGAEFSIDASKIYQVLTNLLFNSIKFTPSGKKIFVSAEPAAEEVLRLEVRDEGIGIPDSFLPKLFIGAKGIQRRGTSGEGGTGMGLSIVRTVVELHGGKIGIESKEGEGTSIVILIPKHETT